MPEDYRFHLTIGSRFENIELVQVVLKDSLVRLGMDDDAGDGADVTIDPLDACGGRHVEESEGAVAEVEGEGGVG